MQRETIGLDLGDASRTLFHVLGDIGLLDLVAFFQLAIDLSDLSKRLFDLHFAATQVVVVGEFALSCSAQSTMGVEEETEEHSDRGEQQRQGNQSIPKS